MVRNLKILDFLIFSLLSTQLKLPLRRTRESAKTRRKSRRTSKNSKYVSKTLGNRRKRWLGISRNKWPTIVDLQAAYKTIVSQNIFRHKTLPNKQIFRTISFDVPIRINMTKKRFFDGRSIGFPLSSNGLKSALVTVKTNSKI